MATDESEADGARPAGAASDFRTHRSSVLEKVLEYRFLADLTAYFLQEGIEFDVLRGDVDHQGYDLAIEANGIVRHIQLKAMVEGGKRADVTVNMKLAARPSGCVVWMRYDPATFAIGPFAWFGSEPGEALPDIGSRVARHSKANAQGLKAERPGHRVVRANAFERLPDIATLADRLFGCAAAHHAALLATNLRERAGDYVNTVIASLCPDHLCWSNSAELALLIDGYKLVERAGLGDPFTLYEPRLAEARETGRWPGDLLELWVTLYLEHRRWRMSDPFTPDNETCALLDGLCEQLQRELRAAGYR